MKLLSPQTGTAFLLESGQSLKVIDVEGEQVADLFCYSRIDPREWLSSGRSIDYNERLFLTKGHVLYSNRSRPMLEILEDEVGRHDFLITPCSQEMYELEGLSSYHPNCFDNLSQAFKPFGLLPDTISTTFNIFMNVVLTPQGEIEISPPRSHAGQSLVLQAKMDLIVGLTACSDEQTNNGSLKPIGYSILKDQ